MAVAGCQPPKMPFSGTALRAIATIVSMMRLIGGITGSSVGSNVNR